MTVKDEQRADGSELSGVRGPAEEELRRGEEERQRRREGGREGGNRNTSFTGKASKH